MLVLIWFLLYLLLGTARADARANYKCRDVWHRRGQYLRCYWCLIRQNVRAFSRVVEGNSLRMCFGEKLGDADKVCPSSVVAKGHHPEANGKVSVPKAGQIGEAGGLHSRRSEGVDESYKSLQGYGLFM